MKLIKPGNVLAAAVLAVTLALTGCAAQEPDYDPKVADRLQAEVLEVSQLSAAADYSAAMLALAELEVELKDALARGAITAERYESVMAALNLVRADLQAAIDALTPPPPVVDDSGNGEDDDKKDDDKKDDEKGKGNEGKGKGNGNDD